MKRLAVLSVLAAMLASSCVAGASDLILSGSYLDYIMKRSAITSDLNDMHRVTPPLISVELVQRPAQEHHETDIIPYEITPRDKVPAECVFLNREKIYAGTKAAILGPETVYVGVPVVYTLKAETYLLDVERYNCWTTYRSFIVSDTKFPEGRVISVAFDEPGPVTLKLTYENSLGYAVTAEKEINVQVAPFRSLNH